MLQLMLTPWRIRILLVRNRISHRKVIRGGSERKPQARLCFLAVVSVLPYHPNGDIVGCYE